MNEPVDPEINFSATDSDEDSSGSGSEDWNAELGIDDPSGGFARLSLTSIGSEDIGHVV